MSELREHLFIPYSELQDGDELTDAFTLAKSYYLKSEADKAIAELEESHKMEVEQLLMEIVELKKQVHDYAQKLTHHCQEIKPNNSTAL